MCVCISAKRVLLEWRFLTWENLLHWHQREEKKFERIWWSFLIKPSFVWRAFFFWLFRVLEKISVSATCVIVSKKDANFSASERGIYTRDVIRSERYNNDRERRKRGRSGRHRGGTVHSFYFYCSFINGSIARVLTRFCLLFPKLLALEYNCLPSRRCFLCIYNKVWTTHACKHFSVDIPPKLQNRKNARDRLVRESESRRARSDRAQSGH